MTHCGAIFDLDGTLVDSAALHAASWERLCEELGQAMDPDLFRRTFGCANRDIIPELLGRPASDEEIEQHSRRKEELYREVAAEKLELMPGALDLLRRLKSDGWKLAIGSSTPRANLDFIVPLLGLTDLLDATVGMEDVTAYKPAPDVFLEAARRLDVAPERCLVFEDAPAGIAAAVAGGMKAVAVLTHHTVDRLPGAVTHKAGLWSLSARECARLLDDDD